jgi:uncharacterized membrane protein (DUF106 family)
MNVTALQIYELMKKRIERVEHYSNQVVSASKRNNDEELARANECLQVCIKDLQELMIQEFQPMPIKD